jgi:hypothetical protein
MPKTKSVEHLDETPQKEETVRDILEENHQKESEEAIEKPQEEKEVTPAKEKEEEKSEPAIDKEAIKKELREEVAKEVKETLVESIQGKKEGDSDEYEKFRRGFFAKEGRQPNWKEVADFVKEGAKRELRAEEEARQKQVQEDQKKEEQSAKENREKWNSYWDSQIDELTSSGKIPKVEKQDKSDPGVQARSALFEAMIKVNQQRMSDGKPQITSLKEIFYEHYTSPTRQPAGWNAPVAGKSRGGSSESVQDAYTPADRKKSFGQLLREMAGVA